MRFAYVNLLWFVFTLAGGVVLGLFPSTTALHSVTRQWLLGKSDIPVFQTFWKYYRQEFWKSNRLGIAVIIIVAIAAIDIWYIQSNAMDQFTWISIPLFAYMLLSVFFLFFIFPVFAHYELPVLRQVKNAFLIMLISPLHIGLIVICFASLYFVVQAFPAVLFIFGASLYAFITMWISLHRFQRIQGK